MSETREVAGVDDDAVSRWLAALGIEFAAPLNALPGRDRSRRGCPAVLARTGLWKLAIIAEGVMRRAMDQPQNKAAAGTPAIAQIDAPVHKACEIADSAGIDRARGK